MIEDIGAFRCRDGQPLRLNAYPPVVKSAVLPQGGQDQAYRGQDLVEPATSWPATPERNASNARRLSSRRG